MNKKVLMTIDLNNMCMRCFRALKLRKDFGDINLYKINFIKSLVGLIKLHKPTRLVVAMEGGNNWRYKVYSEYKANRKLLSSEEAELASEYDMNKFYEINNTFIEGLQKAFKNVEFVKISGLEADDVIALYTKHHRDYDTIINVSTDKDFYQLYKYPNYKQYNPTKKEFIECISPDLYLQCKVIHGDSGDNVPKLQKGIGMKKAEKFIVEGTLDKWLDDNGYREQYEINTKLISFKHIPVEYDLIIQDTIKNNETIGKFDERYFNMFIMNHGLGYIFENSNEYANVFKQMR